MDDRADRFAALRAGASDEAVFEVRRERIQPGRSFSEDAMEDLIDEVTLFVGARLMARWDRTGEPPTVLRIHVKVDVG